jgi:hypothetical protein
MSEDAKLPLPPKARRKLAPFQIGFLIVVGLAGIALVVAGGWIVAGLLTPTPRGAIAMVGRSAITAKDIDAEATAAGLSPAVAAAPETKARLLAQVIDRRLLVQAAQAQGFDKDPGFQAYRKRMDETLMANALAQRFAGTGGDADDATAQAYMTAHPEVFASREAILIDRIVYHDTQGEGAASLKDINTMDDLQRRLQSLNTPFQHDRQQMDSATTPPELLKQLHALKPGELFYFPFGDKTLVGQLISITPNVAPMDQQMAVAKRAAGQAKAQARVKGAIDALKTKTKITYASGWTSEGPPR